MQVCFIVVPSLSSDIEVEQPVDQEEAREVEEEKGEGPGTEPQEATPHQAAVKQVIIKSKSCNSS